MVLKVLKLIIGSHIWS